MPPRRLLIIKPSSFGDIVHALPVLAFLPPVIVPQLVPEALHRHARSAFPPPAAAQRGPPAA